MKLHLTPEGHLQAVRAVNWKFLSESLVQDLQSGTTTVYVMSGTYILRL